jgi:predicted alpha/beta-fold hydrolase
MAALVRERWELADGDFLDLDWLRRGQSRLAILSHGLEGSSAQGYIRGLASALELAGWDVLAWNFRGCSGEPNRLPRFYHSGETGDLRAMITRAAVDYERVALIGFSLGGNVTLKYLGEAPPHPAVNAAAVVSVPIDLAACARRLDREWDNRFYLCRFLATMRTKIAAKARQFPESIDVNGLPGVTTFEQFDGRFTALLHGFRDADDYWARSSARQFLPDIAVPTLLLSARNDPFLAPSCFPDAEAEANPHLFLEAPQSGGHVGFLDFRAGLRPWWERRVVAFLDEYCSGR